MHLVLIRFDGALWIGQSFDSEIDRSILFEPATIIQMPIQIQSRVSGQSGVAFQTNVVFLECDHINLPLDVIRTTLNPDDRLAKHYIAALEIYKKTAPEFIAGKQKH